MAKDKNGKLAPEITSLGEAFMDHCERHHNTGAFTPSYLKDGGADKTDGFQQRLNERISELKTNPDMTPYTNIQQNKNSVLQKQIDIIQGK